MARVPVVPVRTAVLVLLLSLTLSLHYMLLPFPHLVHLVHRRFCYVPILLAALWFGLRGGLAASVVISLATLPLAVRFRGVPWENEDLVEMTFYLGLGLLAGLLVDRREAERRKALELRQKLEASERLASLGRMASGVAHEVRTPLGSIQGAAEILAEDFPEGHPRRPFYDILWEEIGRLKRVVEDFLDLGRTIPLEWADVDTARILEEVRRSVSPAAETFGVRLVVEASGLGPLRADPHRLHQALANLVQNALQVSPRGSTVHVRAWSDGEGVLFEVADEGPGLPQGDENRIFEPFFTRRKGGTGLGLALVRQIARAHGGEVRGETLGGRGARFLLTLPREPKPGGESDA